MRLPGSKLGLSRAVAPLWPSQSGNPVRPQERSHAPDRDLRLFLLALIAYSSLWLSVQWLSPRTVTSGLILTAAFAGLGLYGLAQAAVGSIYRCAVSLALLSGSEVLFVTLLPYSRWLFVKYCFIACGFAVILRSMQWGRLFPAGFKMTHLLFILYALLNGVLVLFSADLFNATARWIPTLAGLGILTVVTALKPSQRQTRALLYGFLVGQQGMVVLSLYDYLSVGGRARLKLSGVGQMTGPNVTGMHIGAGLIIAIVLYYHSNDNARRVVFGAIAFLSSFAILLTVTRGAMVAAVIPMVFLILSRGARSAKNVAASMLIAAIVIVCAYMAEEQTGGYVSQRFDQARTGTWSGRQKIWNKALEEFPKSPIIGIGVGGDLAMFGMESHNEAIGVLLETGIVGMLLFLGWHGSLLASILRRRRSGIRDGRLAFFMYVVLSSMSIRYRLTFVYLLFAIALEGWNDTHIAYEPKPVELAGRFAEEGVRYRLCPKRTMNRGARCDRQQA